MSSSLLTEIGAYATQLVEEKQTAGCVVAAIDVNTGDAGTFAVGRRNAASDARWAGDTLFGLNSITKVFTAIMFARSVQSGVLDEQDYIDGHLPPGTRLQPQIQCKITLRMLANYTSQFPNNPTNLGHDPAAYTIAMMRQYLEHFAPDPGLIGTHYEYSSFGFGLLGYILVAAYQVDDYEQLVKELLTGPLGMNDTVVQPSAQQRLRLAVGYRNGNAQPPLEPPPFLGGGGVLRSTGEDMLRFLRALVEREAGGPLRAAFEHAEQQTFALKEAGIGLGWFIKTSADGVASFAKDGGGSGFGSLIAYVPEHGVGLFAAANEGRGLHFGQQFVQLIGPVDVD